MTKPQSLMNRTRSPLFRHWVSRQVLDCGDGVREVTALALAALKIPKLAADTTTPTQSGDSEESFTHRKSRKSLQVPAQRSNEAPSGQPWAETRISLLGESDQSL